MIPRHLAGDCLGSAVRSNCHLMGSWWSFRARYSSIGICSNLNVGIHQLAYRREKRDGPADDVVRIAMGVAIREARLSTFMTQRELERRSGVDQSVISRLESGRVIGLRWERLTAVLAALGVTRIEFRQERPRPSGLPPSSVEELWSLSRRRSA